MSKNTVAAKADTLSAAAFVVADGRKVNIDVHNIALEAIVDEMVQAEAKSYGAHIRIAAKLNDLMPFDWFDIDPKEVSDNATTFKPHWKAVYDGFKRAGHSNPSVPGKRIKDYGRNLRAGLAPNGKTMADGKPLPDSGEGEGAGEGANPAKRSDMLFAVEEIVRVVKRLTKSDDPRLVALAGDITAAAKKHIGLDTRLAK